MAESKKWTFVNAVILCFIACQVCKVKGNSCHYTNELKASIDPSVTTFKRSIDEPYDYLFQRSTGGLECTWTIQASSDDRLIRLNFITFHMMNDTVAKNGDCVAIYDGDQYDTDDREELIQELCSRVPEAVYNSTGRYLSVVFRQGDHGGLRWMTMNYTAVDSSDVLEAALQKFVDAIEEVGIFLVIGLIGCAVFSVFVRCVRRRGNGPIDFDSIQHRIEESFRRHRHTSGNQRHTNKFEGGPSGENRRSSWISLNSSLMHADIERQWHNLESQDVRRAGLLGREADLEDTEASLESETCPISQTAESEPSAPPASLMPPGPNDDCGNPSEPPPSYDSLFK